MNEDPIVNELEEGVPEGVVDPQVSVGESAAPPEETSESGDVGSQDPVASGQLVPVWLAVLVLLLLLAVMGVAGYLLRGVVTGDAFRTPAEYEIKRWRAQVDEDPSNLSFRLNLAFAYQQDRQFDRALKEYDVVLDEVPQDTAALYNKGIIYRELKVDKRAEELFWDVLEIDAEHELAAKALGDYYIEKKFYKSAVRAVRPVVQAHPEAADLQYQLGFAYENLGQRDWAEARYRLALKYYPDMPSALAGLERLGVRE